MAKIDLSPPTEAHPVALEAYRMWQEGGRALNESAVQSLHAQLLAIEDMTELFRAVATLAASALFIEQQGDVGAKEKIFAVIKTQAPRFEVVRNEMSIDVQDAAEKLTAQLAKLAGAKSAPKTAPKLDQAAPKGTVSLKNMIPNPALRAPPKKK